MLTILGGAMNPGLVQVFKIATSLKGPSPLKLTARTLNQ